MQRGEIWCINLDPSVGAEIRKTKPALIISVDAIGSLPLRVVVPITGWKDKFAQAAWLVRLEPDVTNNLDKPSAADTFQVRSVSETRFVEILGTVSAADIARVEDAVRIVLDL
jgi:mRNA interferase MazF